MARAEGHVDLGRDLYERAQQAAARDRRPVANWVAVVVERALDQEAAAGREAAPGDRAVPAEVAAYLRKSTGTLANWRMQGRGPKWIKRGGTILYEWADVLAWEQGQPSGGEGIRRGGRMRRRRAPETDAA